MAICGGVNSILTPINYIALNKARMISKTGKSHTFSADADGYARGEGCGMVILKNLKKVHILNFLITVYAKIIMCDYIKYTVVSYIVLLHDSRPSGLVHPINTR